MKYKIVISEGCTSYGTRINDKNIEDLSQQEKNEFIDYLFQVLKERIDQNNVSIESLLECIDYDDYECSKNSCEQCGDTVSRTTWEL